MNTIRDILQDYLGDSRGLYNPDGDCACRMSDLAPCEHLNPDCKIGKIVPWINGDEFEYRVVKEDTRGPNEY